MKFLSLRRNLQSFSTFGEKRFVFNTPPEGTPPEGGAGGETPPENPPEGTPPNPEGGESGDVTPKPANSAEARIAALVKERNDAIAKTKELEDAQNALELKKKEEAGEFKTLYEDTKAQLAEKDTAIAELNKKTKAFEESMQKSIDEQLKKVPDADIELVKTLLDGKSIADQQTIIPSLLEKFSKASSFGGEPKGGAGNPNAKARFSELNAKEKLTIHEEAEFHKLATELSKKQS